MHFPYPTRDALNIRFKLFSAKYCTLAFQKRSNKLNSNIIK